MLLLICVCSGTLHAQDQFDTVINRLTRKISDRLVSIGNPKVAIVNFVDLKNNTTELGNYIADAFRVDFVNANVQVVDKSRMDEIQREIAFTVDNLGNPKEALKLGKMAGVQHIITGTFILLDKSIELTIKVYDINNGTMAAAQRGSLPITPALRELSRSVIGNSGSPSATTTMTQPSGSATVNATDDVYQVRSSDMKKNLCKDQTGNYHGYVCFENFTKTDLILYHIGPITMTPNVLIPSGGKACSPLLWINGPYADEPKARECIFYFKTTDEESPKYTSFTIPAEGCVTKTVPLHAGNLSFKKTKY